MMVEVKNGYYGYPGKSLLLKNITFSVDKSEIMAVLGKNGTGKTTMLKCLTSILKWERGQTFINGRSLSSNKSLSEIGYVPQVHNLSFPYTVRELVTMGRARYIGLFSLPSREDRKKVDEVLEEFGLEQLKDTPCTQLSGGQLQLIYIARALAADPKVLILDEPESHLDFKNQLMILKLIKKLAREKDLACIFNTHYPEHALKISDKTLFLGTHDYLVGDTKELITEANIQRFFDIEAKIFSFDHGNESLKAIVAL